MKRKMTVLILAVVSALVMCTACTAKSDSQKATQNVSTQAPTLPPNVNPDQELARVSTIDQFFNARSITLNEKALRFPLNDSQMKYVGFVLSSDNDIPESIAMGETVENIGYVMQDGLTAYVSATNKTNTNTDYTRCQYSRLQLIKGDCQNVALHLPNKLAWDTKSDIIKKEYGQPKEETQNENGDTVLLYSQQSKTEEYVLKLVTDENGIKEVFIEFRPLT